jgi:hypothetical protein
LKNKKLYFFAMPCVAFVFVSLLLLTTFSYTHAAAMATQLTVPTIAVDDQNWNPKQVFNTGDEARFVVYIHNPSNFPDSVTLQANVINGNGYTLLNNNPWSVTIDGNATPGYAWAITIPTNAASGIYYYHATVTDSSGSVSAYAVFQIHQTSQGVLLSVPFVTQYLGQPQRNYDCGPASDDMVLAYYHKGPGLNENGLIAIRQATGELVNDTDIPGNQRALGYYGANTTIVQNVGTIDQQVGQMLNALYQGHPTIALVHGYDLGRGNAAGSYGDHFLVLVGISSDGNTVYVNDPDVRTPPFPNAGWINGGPNVPLSIQQFKKAVTDAQIGPDGIIVS